MAQRDPSGPDHRPRLEKVEEIDGMVLQWSPFVEYSGNFLTEIYRPQWAGVYAENEPVEHLYTVFAPQGGIRAEWYFHEHTLDRYTLLLGSLDVGLYDGRADSPTFGHFLVVSLIAHDENVPNSIRIPPGVWHSLKWVSPKGMFFNAKLPGYNRELPDKFRVPMHELPSAITWNIEDVSPQTERHRLQRNLRD